MKNNQKLEVIFHSIDENELKMIHGGWDPLKGVKDFFKGFFDELGRYKRRK